MDLHRRGSGPAPPVPDSGAAGDYTGHMMKPHHRQFQFPPPCGMYVVVFLALALTASARAHEPINQSGVQVIRPGVQVLRPGELGRTQSHVPGDPHQHVRQRLEYGKGFRTGHRVNGPMGDIIIWSPTADDSYGSQPGPRFGPKPLVRPHPPTGPLLRHKPEYGEPPKPARD